MADAFRQVQQVGGLNQNNFNANNLFGVGVQGNGNNIQGFGLDQAGFGQLAGNAGQGGPEQILQEIVQLLEQLLQELTGQGGGLPGLGGNNSGNAFPVAQNQQAQQVNQTPYDPRSKDYLRFNGPKQKAAYNALSPEEQQQFINAKSYLGAPSGHVWGISRYAPLRAKEESISSSLSPAVSSALRTQSPIILDLAGTGKPDVAGGNWLPHPGQFDPTHAVSFDVNGDGKPDLTEWVGPKDGILAMPDKNGNVTSGNQLFGTAGGWKDGYQKLASLDKDQDGKLTGNELNGLQVWVDQNKDGKVDKGEMHSLQSLGITEISTQAQNEKSSFVQNGQTKTTWDWWPTYISGGGTA